jgi:EmrB/QacA subfamily drug resistance transporter
MTTESATPVPASVGTSSRRRWWGLLFISLGVAMIIVDTTIVNVAIPSIVEDLHITSSDAQWVQEIYTLVFASLLLPFGRWADSAGRRRMLIIGVIIFGAASVLAALAPSGGWLIGARLLQGVGGAMILPTTLSLLNANFRGRERGIAFAVWGSTIGGTAALGPLLGGWLTTAFSWRWAFGINIPLSLAIIIGVLLCVPESRERGRTRGADLGGAALSAIGFGGIVFGLIEGRNYGWWMLRKPFSIFGIGWDSGISPVPVAIGVGLLALALFVLVERRRNRQGRAVLLDLKLFSISSFRNGNINAGIVSLGEFGLLFALPLWFQNVLGYSAFQAGLALLPLALGSFLASGAAAVLSARWTPVSAVRAGIALEIVGILGIGIFITSDSAWWVTVGPLLLYGMGVGLATAQLTGVVLADVPVEQSGQGSGTQSTSRQIGSALGIAILGTVLFAGLGTLLDDKLDDLGLPPTASEGIVNAVTDSAGTAIPALGEQDGGAAVQGAAEDAFTQATRYTAFLAAGFLLAGLLFSRRLGTGRPDHDEAETDSEELAET